MRQRQKGEGHHFSLNIGICKLYTYKNHIRAGEFCICCRQSKYSKRWEDSNVPKKDNAKKDKVPKKDKVLAQRKKVAKTDKVLINLKEKPNPIDFCDERKTSTSTFRRSAAAGRGSNGCHSGFGEWFMERSAV